MSPTLFEIVSRGPLDLESQANRILKRAEAWRPYRMWAVVLLNVWVRSQPSEVRGPRQVRSRK